MKNFGKIIIFVLVITLLISTAAFAKSETEYADTLYELGLFKGTDKGYELDKTLTREESVTTLVRLLGEESNLDKNDYDEIFSDVKNDRWSFGYVMYCYENKITKGTGANTFSPENPITAQEYVTLILRLLGYTEATPETALQASIHINLINSEFARNLESADIFKRSDMVYIMYRCLMTKNTDNELLSYVLADKGVLSKAEAEQFDVYKNADDINDLIDKLLN